MSGQPHAIRAELERILASEAFATAGRHSRLLRYLVERTLAGEGEQLKEYVLGTEVFDRADSYDPRLDSIVRVEVRRLRTRLEEYYRGPGAADPVVIAIPRGAYIPVFEERSASTTATLPAEADIAKAGRTLSPVYVIAAVLGFATIVLTALLLTDDRTPAAAASVPGVALLPFEHYSNDEEDSLLVARLTDAVTAELAKLGTVSVTSRTSAARYAGTGESATEIAKALRVEFLVEASAIVREDHVALAIRLVDGRLDRKVWVGEYRVPREEIEPAARRIAIDTSAAAVSRAPLQ
jgi:TolB-like protein